MGEAAFGKSLVGMDQILMVVAAGWLFARQLSQAIGGVAVDREKRAGHANLGRFQTGTVA